MTAPFYYETGKKARGTFCSRFGHLFATASCYAGHRRHRYRNSTRQADKRDDVPVVDRRAAVESGPTEVRTQGAYVSYLLRLWREGEETAGWRASLHDPHTGARLGFASLDDLVAYLRQETDAVPGPQAGNG